MSTSYDFHCLDCREESRLEDGGCEYRDGESLERLLTHGRGALETLGMLSKEDWRLTLQSSVVGVMMDFFGRHAGHSIEVRDEYGKNMRQREEDDAKWQAEKLARPASNGVTP